jgi:hypothetical protein
MSASYADVFRVAVTLDNKLKVDRGKSTPPCGTAVGVLEVLPELLLIRADIQEEKKRKSGTTPELNLTSVT